MTGLFLHIADALGAMACELHMLDYVVHRFESGEETAALDIYRVNEGCKHIDAPVTKAILIVIFLLGELDCQVAHEKGTYH